MILPTFNPTASPARGKDLRIAMEVLSNDNKGGPHIVSSRCSTGRCWVQEATA